MFAEVITEITIEFFVVRLNWGVGNFVYYYIVVQAGSGFDIDTNTALYLTVAAKATAEVITEIATKITAEVLAEVIIEILIVQLN